LIVGFLSFFRRGVVKENPNRLLTFERLVFQAVLSKSYRNIVFRSVCLQLASWLKVGSVGAGYGLPHWFRRRSERNEIAVRVGRVVGSDATLARPVEEPLSFNMAVDGASGSSLALHMGTAIVGFTCQGPPFTDHSYPEATRVELGDPALADDLPYWTERVAGFAELAPLIDALDEMLSTPTNVVPQNVVLPASLQDPIKQIEGQTLDGAFARLLEFSDGIRVNSVRVWGSHTKKRVFEHEGKRYIRIGQLDTGARLHQQIVEGRLEDTVYRETRPAGKLRRCSPDIITVLLSALK
jgi:hypothetical protein